MNLQNQLVANVLFTRNAIGTNPDMFATKDVPADLQNQLLANVLFTRNVMGTNPDMFAKDGSFTPAGEMIIPTDTLQLFAIANAGGYKDVAPDVLPEAPAAQNVAAASTAEKTPTGGSATTVASRVAVAGVALLAAGTRLARRVVKPQWTWDYRVLPFRLFGLHSGRRTEPNTDDLLVDTARPILFAKRINSLSGEAFVGRARLVAEQHGISWVKIAALPELAPTNLDAKIGEEETVELLNAISKTVQELRSEWPSIHWCSVGRGQAPGGDFKKSLVKPDYRASVVLKGSKTTAQTPWQKLVSTGEYESQGSVEHGQQQMLHYLLEHLRYNPQLPEGFAILRLKSGFLRFASANACRILVTPDQPAHSADALIAYVILVYDSLRRQNASIEWIEPPAPTDLVEPPAPTDLVEPPAPTDLVVPPAPTDLVEPPAPTDSPAPKTSNAQYRLHHSTSHYDFDTTIARHRPGRATFGGPSLDGKYFCKMSWQDSKDDHRSERFFYQTAGELPGLARLKLAWTNITAVSTNPYDPTASGPERHVEVVVLSCVGQHITSCKTVQQSLFVMHDTIDVSRRLALKNVIHRDFSEGNVLCDPIYADGKQPTSFTCAQAATNTLNPSPQCLVIDLDHAKVVEGGNADPAKFEVTGTPLYMSSELLPGAGAMSWRERNIPTVKELLPRIPSILSDRFEQMFPEYKTFNALRTALTRVLEKTAKLFKDEDILETGDEPPIHTPRHDLESIFWVFSIFFASALPEGAENEPTDAFNNFMHDMHANNRRETWFDTIKKVLHPQLKALAPLLYKIARLLFCIPWCLLPAESTTTMPHPTTTATTATSDPINMSTLAHDVVRFMLLTFLFDGQNSEILETNLAMGITRKLQAPVVMFTRASMIKRKISTSDQAPVPKRLKVEGAGV
ncbi:hypothetical protein BKA62DRAFT_830719 [Auriculariales sp. MPI-PUGE-AT-0066]|nr:hypothetical protein BKA62DRAFT_830719 [Auriculariales sp. MPI-PUGE-AT-0066]